MSSSPPGSLSSSRSITPVHPLSVLRPFVANSSEWPRLLAEQKQVSNNITSFTSSPAPGTLTIVPYPCRVDGTLLPPGILWKFATTHNFDLPRCFHGIPSRTFKVPGNGPNKGKFIAACGRGPVIGSCPFRVSFTDIFDTNVGVVTKTYQPLTALTQMTVPTPTRMQDANEETLLQAIANSLQDARDILEAPVVPRRVRKLRKEPLVMMTMGPSPSPSSSTRSRSVTSRSRDQSASTRPSLITNRHDRLSPSQQSLLTRRSDSPPSQSASCMAGGYRLSSPHTPYDHQTPTSLRAHIQMIHQYSPSGIPVEDFWKMFAECTGCRRIMRRLFYDSHCCDLTHLD